MFIAISKTKLCNRCKTIKLKSEFGKWQKGRDGLQQWCKTCMREYQRAYDVEWRRRQPSHKREARLKRKREYEIQRKYGMTIAEIEQMVELQGNRCGICRHRFSEKIISRGAAKGGYCVDHCHKTGKVRSALCTQCNVMIAMARDKIRVLKAAIRYLAEHSE